MYAKKSSNLKILAVLLAIALLIGCGIGGTIAWLKDSSGPITNTFSTTGLTITLTEPNFDQDDAKMIPGATITKDPKVTVAKNSEDCYVFVKIETSEKFNTFMEYAVANTWKEVPGAAGVYYRAVESSTADQDFPVLVDDEVTVSSELTKEDMTNASFTMEISAYAIQSAYLKNSSGDALTETDIAAIWAMAQENPAE